jgi:poly(3-hydroxybutyrate) depolymerase
VPQHLALLTPFSARADSPGKYFWSCYYMTRELGPQTVQTLLSTHPDFQEKKGMEPDKRASLRLRKADFYAQAGWFELAEKELDRALSDMPEKKERIEAARKALNKLRARDRLEEIKHRHLAGQHQLVRKQLADFTTKDLPEALIAELQELKAEYEATDQLVAESARLLDKARREVEGPEGKLWSEAAAAIGEELNFENVGRLDAFLGQARQAERLQRKGKKADVTAEQLLSLAVSGWLMGSASAETSPETALRLWNGRQMVLTYLRTEDEAQRLALLRKHTSGSRRESASLDELIQIVRTLPPVEADKQLPSGSVERKTDAGKYLLRLPPEYRHGRPTPVLILLHNGSGGPKDILDRWAESAAEYGYILAAPQWGDGLGGGYTYSEGEHALVLATLRDLRRRFNVDSDRVFLFGLGDGGAMAFDVGLGHPDLFAGVLPMGAGPQFHAEMCWRNGQYLPFYIMHGNRGPRGKEIRQQFENWVYRNFPMVWVDYKGRGVEWYGGEVASMFDWMRSKKREFPMHQLGTDGAGGTLGNEFCSMRACDTHFYWLSADEINPACFNSAANWKNRQPASLHARIARENNFIWVKTSGVRKATIWLGRNGKGEDMIDFDKPVTVIANLQARVSNQRIKPSAEVMLEDLYQRGDRQQLFLAKITLPLR